MPFSSWLRLPKTRPIRCAASRPQLTRLEDRVQPATIAWDGGPTGNGTNWLDPVNWVGDVLPDADDDVFLDSTGSNPTIVLSGTTAVKSVTSTRSLSISGGTLELGEPSTFSANLLIVNGGTLTGTGDVVIQGMFTWDGHNSRLGGSGIVTLGGTSYFGSGLFLDRPLVNGGLTVVEAYLTTAAGVVVTNAAGGVLEFHDGRVLGAGTLVNHGLVRRSPSPWVNPQLAVQYTQSASGAILVEDNRLDFTAGGSIDGTVTVNPGAAVSFGGDFAFAPTSMVAGTSVTFTGGSLTGNLNASEARVVFQGGAQAVSATYVASETVVRSYAQMTGSIYGLGKLTVDGGSITLSPSTGPTTLSLPQLDNYGTGGIFGTASLVVTGPTTTAGRFYLPRIDAYGGLTLLGGRLFGTRLVNHGVGSAPLGHAVTLHAGAVLENRGTLTLADTLIDRDTTDPATMLLLNSGLITKPTGSARATFGLPVTSTGTIEVGSGELEVTADGTSGASITGTVNLAPGTILSVRGPLSMSGDLNGDGATVIYGSGSHVLSGRYATGVTEVRSSVNVTGTIDGLGRLFVNGGSITLSPASGPTTLTLSQLDNYGTGGIFGTASLVVTGPTTTAGRFYIPRIDAYGGLTLLGGRLFGGTLVNHGTGSAPGGDALRLHAGAVLENRGTLTIGDAHIDRDTTDPATMLLLNSGLITKPTGSARATFGLPVTSTGTIEVGSGELEVTADGTSGASITGTVNLAPGTILSVRGPLSMSGDLNATGARVIFVSGAHTLSGNFNTGETEVRSNVQLTGAISGLGKLYVNGGSITLSPSTGPTTLSLPQLDNYGTGGIFGTASLVVTGPTTTAGRFYLPRIDAYGGLTILGGRVFGSKLVNYGTANAHDFVLHDGAHLQNYGSWTLVSGGIDVDNGAAITNGVGATFSLKSDGTIGRSGACIPFINQGSLVKDASLGTTFIYAQVINTGVIRVNTGTMRIHCGITQPSGSNGSVSGNVEAPVDNNGTVTASPTPIPPTVTGYTQSSLGNLIEQIGGNAPGTQYGQIIVNGDVALDGTLQVQLINSFTPQLNEQFTVIVNNGSKSVDGAFIGLPEWTPGGALVYSGFIGFSVSYQGGDGNDVVLTVRQVAQPTTTVVSATAATPLFGVDDLTLTATVTAASGTPTGSVSFFDGVTLLGSAILVGGVAALPLADTDLAVSTHTIRAVYNGDGGFLASEGTVEVNVIAPSTLHGLVWLDFNNDGEVNFGEKAISGVTITLTGFDDLGNSVVLTTQSDANGIYAFNDLRPSSSSGYTVTQTQPAGYLDGIDTLGDLGGDDSVNDVFSGIVLHGGSVAADYNFGERPMTTGGVVAGQTATIGFWQNKNGQNLIKVLNGGSTATQLGNWLATTFPNMYGALAGKSNAEVAAHYKTLFAKTAQSSLGGPPKLDAQVMATALAVFVTNQTLAGNTATAYGFLVTQYGVGAATFNVGSNGSAFGFANNTNVSVLDLLFAVDDRSHNGILFDIDGSGAISSLESAFRTMANAVFSAINESGGV